MYQYRANGILSNERFHAKLIPDQEPKRVVCLGVLPMHQEHALGCPVRGTERPNASHPRQGHLPRALLVLENGSPLRRCPGPPGLDPRSGFADLLGWSGIRSL
jgi:hypothetical protein